jgi:hypothetical protein
VGTADGRRTRVHDQNAIGVTEPVGHQVPHIIAHLVGVPLSSALRSH